MSKYVQVNKAMLESIIHIAIMRKERGESIEEILEAINKILEL